ncbi:complex I NDUFA9 subunit family protein [Humisphaera borealis]|uniref:Complex I NDUFA9 subunit family protein n=1 Tax=Humisphaera borealis TaxID=2807512 RepID=A0A7M2WVU9_9BACT|nr:complex I NDUFA9 subunit family protein [Humisphaera borealis]QOV89615.1 complex I NDUFA9 subunit family protein [Humisphaera borealis]
MARNIFVTGGSGFVGTAVVDELVSRDYSVQALVRKGSLDSRGGKVTSFVGDLFDPKSLAAGMAGCDAVIHLVGIIMEQPSKGVTFERMHFEGTRSVVDATKAAGIRRYVHMSALGVRPNAVSAYHKTKWKAEEYVRGSGLDATILRPSMIHGPKGEFMKMEAAWARKQAMPFLFMPYFGNGVLGLGGSGQLQPVYVADVARAFVDALDKPNTIGQTYELGGPDRMDWPTMHKTVAEILTGKNRLTMPIPSWYAKVLATVVPGSLLPFNKAQVQMAEEDNVCDTKPAEEAFGWKTRGLRETLSQYKGQMTE